MIKKITIDGLARMVSKGFTETKSDIGNLRSDMNKRFDGVDARLDHIEKLILADHKRRIEKLELDMRELKSALAM